MTRTQAQVDGYVECSECGHTVEWDHDRDGCGLCSCSVGWTRDQKRELRRREGLPASWPATGLYS